MRSETKGEKMATNYETWNFKLWLDNDEASASNFDFKYNADEIRNKKEKR
jgi:hypothetical protein